ncbi:MAG TPA: energy-coupling factor transporter transmembrane component T [Syntrophorhabdaceae bacterium]|nr:energy-coupling factor transporter transmembrane component T [Syntrophorhabdaceae bacterium]
MNLSLYQDKDTWIHRLDPRTKITGIILIFAMCLCFNDPIYIAILTLGVLFILFFARSLKSLWTLRYILILLFLFSMIIWPFFVKGKTVWLCIKGFYIHKESILYAIAMGLRLSTFVMAGMILISTTKNEDITNGLIMMGLPYPIAFAISTALRLVPTFAGAGATIVQAQISRGLDLESKNIFKRFSKFIPFAVPIFIIAIRYTNLLSMALESRGFSPASPRTMYRRPYMKKNDWIVLISLLIVFVIILYIRIFLQAGIVIKDRL